MAKHTLKIVRCEHRKIFKVCLAIFQHYEIKGEKVHFSGNHWWSLCKNLNPLCKNCNQDIRHGRCCCFQIIFSNISTVMPIRGVFRTLSNTKIGAFADNSQRVKH